MAQAVELRDIRTDADRIALLALRRGPRQARYLGSMESQFEDAADEPRAKPRMWSAHHRDTLVGFVMISDGIEALDDDLIGPHVLALDLEAHLSSGLRSVRG